MSAVARDPNGETREERFARWMAPGATAQLALLSAFVGRDINSISSEGRHMVQFAVGLLALAAVLVVVAAITSAHESSHSHRLLWLSIAAFILGVAANAFFLILWF